MKLRKRNDFEDGEEKGLSLKVKRKRW